MAVFRPQVVAHRGSSARYPEHTRLAFEAAIADGADAIECDVRLTADGHLVCLHDRTLARTAGADEVVSTLSLAELQRYDFGALKGHPGQHVVRLEELLQIVREAPREVKLAIETKHPVRYAGAVERRLAEVLEDFSWADADSPVRVMSFSWWALRRMSELTPDLDLVFLMDRAGEWDRVRRFVDHEWIAGPGVGLLRRAQRVIDEIAESRTRLHVWTVNDPVEIDLCLDWGVEAIITDKPAETQAHLDLRLGEFGTGLRRGGV